ncbi:MAG: hypothetical protein CM1200mP22_06590 [Dehalococcoidia bacterium]|nr:MAG: hypothetical protein CM1200mP22_06590 [Dehalococcoidia bacterium]
MYNAVGGSLIHWGAHFPRFHPSDFRVKTLEGVADDWPISYEELEPYYDENDRMMGVSGRRVIPPILRSQSALALRCLFGEAGNCWLKPLISWVGIGGPADPGYIIYAPP